MLHSRKMEADRRHRWAGKAGWHRRPDKTEGGDTASTGTGGFAIDNQNIYEGMENSYSGGYTPKTDGKKAVVVLPLLSRKRLAETNSLPHSGLGGRESALHTEEL